LVGQPSYDEYTHTHTHTRTPSPCEKVCDIYVVNKVYFWNLTNPQAVVDGLEPPKLVEVRL
jgi:hypothetical protein